VNVIFIASMLLLSKQDCIFLSILPHFCAKKNFPLPFSDWLCPCRQTFLPEIIGNNASNYDYFGSFAASPGTK
jgi:hypothetical protein